MSGAAPVTRAAASGHGGAAAALLALVDLHDRAEGPALLQPGPGRRVTRLTTPLGQVVCKEEPCRGWGSRLRRRLLGARADRAAAAARALRAAGIEAPEPLGTLVLPGRTLGFARFVEGPTLARALEEADAAGAGALLALAAALAARLHRAGFTPRDLKPQNLVLTGAGSLVPVDLDDVTLRPPDAAAALRNLAALDAYAQLAPRPPGVAARVRALRDYAGALGRDPGPLLRAALGASRAKRAAIAARTGAGGRAGPESGRGG